MRNTAANDSIGLRLLRAASVEISSRDPKTVARVADWFAPGSETFINFLPGSDYRPTIETAVALRRAGFEPVPHITARSFADAAELTDLLARLAGEAGVRKVMAIGGDVSVPRGPYASTLNLIESGALERSGIAGIGLAAYPEGHHTLAFQALEEALRAKLGAARARGLEPFIVTQFCFEAAPVLQWLAKAHADGVEAPVRIGIAGPASMRALLTFAMRCGVGASIRVLLNQPQSIGRLLRDASPDALVRDLDGGLASLSGEPPTGFHLYPFGGVAKTGEWRRKLLE
jgi:methylenetetrahydrofolate reductase (NADPH)